MSTGVTAAMSAQETDRPKLPLYVLIPPSPLFAAHWSLFIPDTSSFDTISKRHEESSTGRRIHVSGDRLNGFHLEIIRNYDISKHKAVGSTRRFKVALIPPSCSTRDTEHESADSGNVTQKDDDEGGGYVHNRPTDDFECAVLQIEAPGPSLNSAQSTVGLGGRRVKAELKDCQWWVKQVVTCLFEQGLLMPIHGDNEMQESKDPPQIIQNLPVH